MKKYTRTVVLFVTVIMLSISFSTSVYANSAEPPSITIIVSNPPEDLSLSLQLPDKLQTEAIVLNKEQKAWETYYRFFNYMTPLKDDNLDGAVLIVQSNEQNFQCPLPTDTFKLYNNLLTLNMDTQSLTVGQSPTRVPILVAMRVVLTLLIEGIIFFLFGYRKVSSWIVFFLINIITQGGLNALLTGPGIGSYWIIGFLLGEVAVMALEMVTFTSLVKEFRASRAALYTFTANIVSLILGGLLITYLPV